VWQAVGREGAVEFDKEMWLGDSSRELRYRMVKDLRSRYPLNKMSSGEIEDLLGLSEQKYPSIFYDAKLVYSLGPSRVDEGRYLIFCHPSEKSGETYSVHVSDMEKIMN
jgi:hypothetical protein